MAKSGKQAGQKKASSAKAQAGPSAKSAKAPAKQAPAAKKPKSTEGYERVFEQIYRMVLRIPAGRVMTYGQIARLLDERYSPRLVGWAMHATPNDERHIPWHRVINSRGSTSTGRLILHEPDLQRLLLEGEGVVFNDKAVCDLSIFQWSPAQRKAKAEVSGKPAGKAAKSAGAKAVGKASRTKTAKTGKKN